MARKSLRANEYKHIKIIMKLQIKLQIPFKDEIRRVFNCTFLLIISNLYSQTQIGQTINGEAAADEFGRSISLSSDGNILAVGAYLNDGNGIDSGHVRVYENINGTWIQQGQDIDGEAPNDNFGSSVSLSSNGNILAVGGPVNDGNGINSGHVRIFENINGTWVQIGQDIDGEAPNDFFGWSLSLSSNGNILAVGAPASGGNGINSGHVRIFEYQNGTWVQVGQDIDGDPFDNLGFSLSLSGDGNILAIGALLGNNGTGYARVYQNLNGSWTQVGQDIDGEADTDLFGAWLSLSSDGSILAVGAPGHDGNGDTSGLVQIFQNQNGSWIQVGQDINGEAADNESGSVSLSADGSVIAIGAPRNDENGINSGHTRIYKNQNGTWVQLGQDIDGEASFDEFGLGVSLSSDGSILAISATGNDGNGDSSGHVRVYDLSALLSINEQSLVGFKLHPNPSTSQFHIQLEDTSQLKSVRLYNQIGQLVLQTKETVIKTENLTSGIYLVRIETTDGEATRQLIIN
jgi:hypothetical protein